MTKSFAPVDNPETLARFVTRYQSPAILFAALETGILARLSISPMTSSNLAQELRLDLRGTDVLLDCLCALGTVTCNESVYAIADNLRGPLASGSDFARGLLSYRDQNRRWLELASVLRGGSDEKGFYDEIQTPALVSSYLKDVEDANRGPAAQLADSLSEMRTFKRVLDIGSGHGLYLRELNRVFPDAVLTAFDLPHALDITRNALHDLAHDGKVEFVAGNAKEQTFESVYDLIMINDVLHYLTAEERDNLIARAGSALSPDGMLVVSKLAKPTQTSIGSVMPLLSMRFYINTHGGFLDADAETEARLAMHFDRIERREFENDKCVFFCRSYNHNRIQ